MAAEIVSGVTVDTAVAFGKPVIAGKPRRCWPLVRIPQT